MGVIANDFRLVDHRSPAPFANAGWAVFQTVDDAGAMLLRLTCHYSIKVETDGRTWRSIMPLSVEDFFKPIDETLLGFEAGKPIHRLATLRCVHDIDECAALLTSRPGATSLIGFEFHNYLPREIASPKLETELDCFARVHSVEPAHLKTVADALELLRDTARAKSAATSLAQERRQRRIRLPLT